MAVTFTTAKDILREVTDNIQNSPREHWENFLRCVSYQYKYPLNDQFMIYAQRPNCVACASFDTWKKIGTHVEIGSKGIGLINFKTKKMEYVFDITDTGKAKEISGIPWTIDDPTFILNQLEMELQQNIASNTNIERLTSLVSGQYPEQSEFVQSSISYIIANRLGLDIEDKTFFSDNQLKEVTMNFREVALSVSDSANELLRKIEKLQVSEKSLVNEKEIMYSIENFNALQHESENG